MKAEMSKLRMEKSQLEAEYNTTKDDLLGQLASANAEVIGRIFVFKISPQFDYLFSFSTFYTACRAHSSTL